MNTGGVQGALAEQVHGTARAKMARRQQHTPESLSGYLVERVQFAPYLIGLPRAAVVHQEGSGGKHDRS